MTIAPFVENPEENRPIFAHLRKLSVDIAKEKTLINITMSILSMGMTNDYQVAIEEGATMVVWEPEFLEHVIILIKYKRKIGDLLKMGVLDKFLSIMKLDDGDDEYDEDEFFDDDDMMMIMKKSPREASFIKTPKTMIKISMKTMKTITQHL